MTNPQPDNQTHSVASLNPVTDRTERQPEPGSPAPMDGPLTCQWCSVTLPPGTTVCPECGSAGVPDARMVVPDSELGTSAEYDITERPQEEIEEIIAEARDPEQQRIYKNSAKASGSQATIIYIAIGVAVASVVIGVLAAPLLAPLLENITGSPVEDTNDLRPLGGVLGLIFGLFIATIGVWIGSPKN